MSTDTGSLQLLEPQPCLIISSFPGDLSGKCQYPPVTFSIILTNRKNKHNQPEQDENRNPNKLSMMLNIDTYYYLSFVFYTCITITRVQNMLYITLYQVKAAANIKPDYFLTNCF